MIKIFGQVYNFVFYLSKMGERPGGLRGNLRKLLPSSTGFGAATRGERSPALEQKRYPNKQMALMATKWLPEDAC